MRASAVVLGLLGLAGQTLADPTWPSPIDELEEIMFQLTSFRARKFSGSVSPCSSEASGPGRQNAAEWLRTAFHDMSTANVFFGTGGLDGSLQYELRNTENKGPGLTTTLEFMAPYLSRRASLADLLAMGVYTSVRSCGGPAVPIRAGRQDATVAGNVGVPQPENSVLTFQQQFERMGFTREEMIQVTACGHTLGGVHSQEFPDILPAASTTETNGQRSLDSSTASFDNKVVTEYLEGETENPLVVGPSVRLNKHSDFKVFNSDGNATVRALADPDAFRNVCKAVLQKMIDVVPRGVALSEPIEPYMVKPVNLQLNLANGGSTLQLTGFIRVRTTELAEDDIANVVLAYKNRDGGSDCGSGSCNIRATVQGVGQGFDDTFAFFPIQANIPAATGISSFTVTINRVDGTSETHDNNGVEYPVDDAVLLQAPQSCLLGTSGALKVVAAVRNDRLSQGASALVSYKVPQSGSPVPLLTSTTVNMEKGNCVGRYTFFSADYTIPGGLAYESTIDVINGDKSDSFKSASNIGGTCRVFANPITCNGGSSTVSRTDPLPTERVELRRRQLTSSSETSSPVTEAPESTTEPATASPTVSAFHRPTVGGYNLVSCWSEGVGARALEGTATADDEMTLESCMEFCSGYIYWGTEYGRECYCGNALDVSSEEAPIEECNMLCGGDLSQYCGAGRRLELYSTTEAPTSASATPTPTPVHREEIGKYDFVGCWTEGVGVRALSGPSTTSGEMTNEICADFCDNFRYFGTEYGSECYCANFLASSSGSTAIEDCNMACGGDASSFCGAGNRLELYRDPDATTGDPEQPPTAGDFVWLGCQTELETRALTGAFLPSDDLTNEACAEFCAEFEYFGTEYGRECYCGNALPEESLPQPDTECRMLCGGSGEQFCGGPNRLSVYVKLAPEIGA